MSWGNTKKGQDGDECNKEEKKITKKNKEKDKKGLKFMYINDNKYLYFICFSVHL